MSFEFKSPSQNARTFWLQRRSLLDRLRFLLAAAPEASVEISTTELSGNASFVNYVRHHHLRDPASGAELDVVEKSIRKVAFITSLESRFYKEREVFAGSVYFQHPACHGVIETPWESIIFTQFVKGRAPRMRSIARQVALGIEEIERLSSSYLRSRHRKDAFKYWQMDFFRPWYLFRPRFNFGRHFSDLRRLAAADGRFDGLERPLKALIPTLREHAKKAQISPHCFCHLDYLRKNLFISGSSLQLIDWSEVKIGRIGFDAGAYLSGLFRRNDMAAFEKTRQEFLDAYAHLIPDATTKATALRNAHYLFLLNSLWHFLRPETAQAHMSRNQMPLMREKLDYLIKIGTLPSTPEL